MPKARKLFVDAAWFKTTQGIIATVGGVLAIATAAITLWPKPGPEPSRQYTEILLDSSEGMKAPFDGTSSKLDAARGALKDLFASSISAHDGLALRKFGGTCGESDTDLVVDFSSGTKDRISDRAGGFQPAGQNSLVHAVAEATGDFNRIHDNQPKRLVVITGGGNRCENQDIGELGRKLEQFKKVGGIGLDMRYIGLSLAPEDQEKLNAVARQSGGNVRFVNTRQELGKALDRFLVVEPVMADANKIIDILNGATDQLNAVIDSINAKDYAKAESTLVQAEGAWQTSAGPFAALEARQHGGNFQQLIANARQQRQIQRDMISLARSLADYAKDNDTAALTKASASYSDLASRYNGSIGDSKGLMDKLASTT